MKKQPKPETIPFSPYAQFANEYRGMAFSRNGVQWNKYEAWCFVKTNKIRLQDVDLFFEIREKADFKNGRFIGRPYN